MKLVNILLSLFHQESYVSETYFLSPRGVKCNPNVGFYAVTSKQYILWEFFKKYSQLSIL